MRLDRILISDIETTIYRYGRIYELMKIERIVERRIRLKDVPLILLCTGQGACFFLPICNRFL